MILKIQLTSSIDATQLLASLSSQEPHVVGERQTSKPKISIYRILNQSKRENLLAKPTLHSSPHYITACCFCCPKAGTAESQQREIDGLEGETDVSVALSEGRKESLQVPFLSVVFVVRAPSSRSNGALGIGKLRQDVWDTTHTSREEDPGSILDPSPNSNRL